MGIAQDREISQISFAEKSKDYYKLMFIDHNQYLKYRYESNIGKYSPIHLKIR
jgi:hypothetical protein